MFSAIKGYLSAGIAVAFALLIGAVKILSMQNAAKSKEIDTLKENAEVQGRVNAGNIKREKFNAKHKAKAETINDDSLLDKLNKERGEVKDEDSNFTTITK